MTRFFRTSLFALLIIACIGLPRWAGPAQAAVYVEPAIVEAIAIRLGTTNPAEIQKAVRMLYPYILQGIGASVRSASSVARHINTQALVELGLVYADHPPVRSAVVNTIRTGNFSNAEELARYLARGPLGRTIARTVPDEFRERTLDIAYRLTQEASFGTVRRTATQQATSGMSAAFRSWAARLGSRLGAVVQWLTSTTASRFFGAVTIAEFTQSQINEALYAFQDEMEAIGDAKEAEAFNNNLRLMMERLEDGRLVLVPGMTLAQAVRKLRRNMNMGGSYFAGILQKPTSSVNNRCQVYPETAPLIRGSKYYIVVRPYGPGIKCLAPGEVAAERNKPNVTGFRNLGTQCTKCPAGGFFSSKHLGVDNCVRCPRGKRYQDGCCY